MSITLFKGPTWYDKMILFITKTRISASTTSTKEIRTVEEITIKARTIPRTIRYHLQIITIIARTITFKEETNFR